MNRFGPGMVIYWLGIIYELADENPDVLLLDDFPAENEITQLARH